MIDLTPLDVRKKRGDFRKLLRGYDPEEVDGFLELVAERLEELVKENLTLQERSERLQEQVASQEGREKAVQDALVTAQELRDDIRTQAQREADEVKSRAEREADLLRREAEAAAQRMAQEMELKVQERQEALEELERHRARFLKGFRSLLERELDMVEVEEGRTPLEEIEVELDLTGGRRSAESPVTGSVEIPEPGPPEAGFPDPAEGEGLPDEAAPPEDDGILEAEALAPDTSDATTEPPDPDAPIHELASEKEGPGEKDREEPETAPERGRRTPQDELWLSSILEEDPESPFGEGGEDSRE